MDENTKMNKLLCWLFGHCYNPVDFEADMHGVKACKHCGYWEEIES